jgi:hypothetical protein
MHLTHLKEMGSGKTENKNVNYFQQIPINFIYNRYDFEYLELKGSNLYWMIN